jgi:hypothetical protein
VELASGDHRHAWEDFQPDLKFDWVPSLLLVNSVHALFVDDRRVEVLCATSSKKWKVTTLSCW